MKDLVPLFQIDLLSRWEVAREKIWKDADSHCKQAVTAAGFGCAAALEAEKWLSD